MTLQKLIDGAIAGTVVELPAGSYNEQVALRSNVTVRGYGVTLLGAAGSAVLVPAGCVTGAILGAAVRGGGRGVTFSDKMGQVGIVLRDLVITDTADTAIIDQGNGTLIDGCHIANAGHAAGSPTFGVHGVYAKGANVVIRGSSVERCRDSGISLRREGADVSTTEIRSSGDGLQILDQFQAPGKVTVHSTVRVVAQDGHGCVYVQETKSVYPVAITVCARMVSLGGGTRALNAKRPITNQTVHVGSFSQPDVV